jgi:hypothetical protein
MIVDRDYIFTLYQMGAGAIFQYLQQIEKRIDDAEARVTSVQQAKVERLSKELALAISLFLIVIRRVQPDFLYHSIVKKK